VRFFPDRLNPRKIDAGRQKHRSRNRIAEIFQPLHALLFETGEDGIGRGYEAIGCFPAVGAWQQDGGIP
jgi:hypothetical protein